MENIPQFFRDELNDQYGGNLTNNIINNLVKKKTSFRVNNLKSSNDEIEKVLDSDGIKYKKVKFYDNAYVLDDNKEAYLREKDFYKNGEIYVQNLSSMIPPIMLYPQKNEDILDMCAAPGGKTAEIACLSNNQSHITACEMNNIRLQRLKHNLDMQNASSVYVMQKDARNLDSFLKFDKILLDSPCSGSGTLDIENPNTFKYFTEYLVEKSVKTQKVLIEKAIELLKPGGEMVYSTCSILKRENEDIVESLLKRGIAEVKLFDEDVFEDVPKLPTKINGAMCVMPSEIYEGFFAIKLIKK